MIPRFEYVYASALAISIFQIVIFFTNLECEIEGWGKDSIRNLSYYVSDTNAPILPKDFCQEKIALLIVVCSGPKNIDARQAIRETWGNQKTVLGERIEIVFLLGNSLEAPVQDAILEESQQFNDVVQENFIDSYYNLTLKSTFMLKLASSNCMEMARFLFKTDDDMFVNIPKLMRIIIERKNIENVLLGRKFCRSITIKNPLNKWYCPSYMFDSMYYPNYLSGTGYLMSLDVAKKLYIAAFATPLIHLEDVYITGFCAKYAGIDSETIEGLFTTSLYIDTYCEMNDLITIHGFSPDRLRRTFRTLNEPGLNETCYNYEPVVEPVGWLQTTIFMPWARSKRRRICY